MRELHSGGHVRLTPMPLDEESRIAVAVDSWSELSEMPDEIAWLIGNVVATGDSENTFDSRAVWPASYPGQGGTPIQTESEDWFRELTKKDRLLAWKIAAYGRAVEDRLLVAVRRQAPELVGPALVAASVSQYGGEPEAIDALKRLAPTLLPEVEEVRAGKDGEWPAWMVVLAVRKPALGIKLAVESMIRGVEKRRLAGEEGRFGVPVFRGVSH